MMAARLVVVRDRAAQKSRFSLAADKAAGNGTGGSGEGAPRFGRK